MNSFWLFWIVQDIFLGLFAHSCFFDTLSPGGVIPPRDRGVGCHFYKPSIGSLHRNRSGLTVRYPFLWGKGKALSQRQQKKLSPSGVKAVMKHCTSIYSGCLERGLCCLETGPYLGPLPGRVQLQGWSGLHWLSRGH